MEQQQRTNLNSRMALIARLRRDRKVRAQFVDSHLGKGISHQLRATRDFLGWSQERLAKETGMNQNAISRLESSGYGKPTITTLKRLAAAMDVGLVVRFVPFSELIDWVSGTPRKISGLTTSALAVPDFKTEENDGVFGNQRKAKLTMGSGAASSAERTPPDESESGQSSASRAAIEPWIIQNSGLTGAQQAAQA